MLSTVPRKTALRLVARSNSTVATHTVFNQSNPLENLNLFKSDAALVDSIKVFGGTHTAQLNAFGVESGKASLMHAAETAEKNKPTLRQFDNYGRRIDVAEYHDTYHTLMKHGLENGCAAHGFKHNTPGSHLSRAALIYMENQVEAGHCCPIVMTAAAIPVLQRHAGFETHVEKLLSHKYDPRNVPMSEKAGITMGMSMTEKQGGSDVRANTTTAVAAPADSCGVQGAYHLTGHKVICRYHLVE
jgi:putative acyl-CoA dehydrogenase